MAISHTAVEEMVAEGLDLLKMALPILEAVGVVQVVVVVIQVLLASVLLAL